MTALGLGCWTFAPDAGLSGWILVAAGASAALRPARWRGLRTAGEPLLLILHVGYGWLALGLLLLGADRVTGLLPYGAALHALTVGAIGTMTLAVMTRATLGHTGRPLAATSATATIYALVTFAALLRVAAPLSGPYVVLLTSLAGAAWTGAFALFVLYFGPMLLRPRAG